MLQKSSGAPSIRLFACRRLSLKKARRRINTLSSTAHEEHAWLKKISALPRTEKACALRLPETAHAAPCGARRLRHAAGGAQHRLRWRQSGYAQPLKTALCLLAAHNTTVYSGKRQQTFRGYAKL